MEGGGVTATMLHPHLSPFAAFETLACFVFPLALSVDLAGVPECLSCSAESGSAAVQVSLALLLLVLVPLAQIKVRPQGLHKLRPAEVHAVVGGVVGQT